MNRRFYGIMLGQTYHYFRTYSKDAFIVKAMVCSFLRDPVDSLIMLLAQVVSIMYQLHSNLSSNAVRSHALLAG